jgi:hypothetical protein
MQQRLHAPFPGLRSVGGQAPQPTVLLMVRKPVAGSAASIVPMLLVAKRA